MQLRWTQTALVYFGEWKNVDSFELNACSVFAAYGKKN